ncbi:MAG: hypothetical protein OEZ15_02240 [Gammaproteobacteria bacterium]|nr:hypothetical protein [Gammaproteobacteria bacterium]
MKHIINKIKSRFAIIVLALLCTACVSSPDEKQPEAIEAANSALSNGVSNYEKSKYELATTYFRNALRDFRSIDHQFGIASSCLNLSKTYLSMGDIELADAYMKQAQRIIEQENITQLLDHLHIIESSIAIENNQHTQAKEILSPLLQRDTNNEFTLAAIQNRTRISHDEMSNNREEAEQWTSKFEQTLKSSNNPSHKARLARFRANLSDDTETQNKYFDRALNIYRTQTNRPGIAATLQEWGNALIQKNQNETASDKLQRALYIRQSLHDRRNSLDILNSLAQISTDSKIKKWIEKLQNKQFNQWDAFTAAINQFPN